MSRDGQSNDRIESNIFYTDSIRFDSIGLDSNRTGVSFVRFD